MYLNKVLLYGNLTRDPEVRALPSGQQVANFSLATNRSYTDKEGRKQELVEYHNVVAFARQAEVIGQYMKKGRPIFVEGRLQTRSWEADGKKNYRTEIVVDNFQFGATAAPGTGGSRDADSSPAGAGSSSASSNDFGGAPDMGGMNMGSPSESSGSDIAYPDDEINPEDIPF
jgi:single-strand DNA-binding protein